MHFLLGDGAGAPGRRRCSAIQSVNNVIKFQQRPNGDAVFLHYYSLMPGVDILQKKPKNAQGGINSALAKSPQTPKKVFLLPRNEEIMIFFALNCHC